MEESRVVLELKFISGLLLTKFMNLVCVETVSYLSVFCSDPLFSCIVTFCTLIVLYLPHRFLEIVFSPVLILTGILLVAILRLGAAQGPQLENKENPGKSVPIFKEENRLNIQENGQTLRENKKNPGKSESISKEERKQSPSETEESKSLEQISRWISFHSETEFNYETGFYSSSCFEESFVEWNVKAPLDVIYEEYEGEEAEEDPNEKEDSQHVGISRYPSLSRYYPESDSDSSSDGGFSPIRNWESLEKICFRCDEEDRDGLIEIALDGEKKNQLEFHFDEDNLIEIDISRRGYRELSGENDNFSGVINVS